MLKERILLPQYFCVVFVMISVSAGRPLTSLFASQLNASLLEIGLLTSCYSLLPLALAIQAGRVTDRVGAKFPIIFASLGIALAMFLPFFYPFLLSLFISQLLLGISQLFALVALQNSTASSTKKEHRERSISNFSLFTSFGMLIGPLIGGYAAEHFSYRVSFCLLAISPLLSVLIAAWMKNDKQDTDQVSKTGHGMSSILKEVITSPNLKMAIIISMLILASMDIFNVYFPLFASSIGMNSAQIGWLLATQALASMMVRLCMSYIVERLGRVRVLWVFILIGAVSLCSKDCCC
jgi:MFS family permease